MIKGSFSKTIKADIDRCKNAAEKKISTFKCFYYYESLTIIFLFRLIQRLIKLKIPFFPGLLKLIYKNISILLGIHINLSAKIGKGFYIAHYGGIFIGPVEIGENCSIFHQVTIGQGGLATDRESIPRLGDNIWIGPGAKIFGKIKIGNSVSIGANSVVSKDIPDNAVVSGNPGRVVGFVDESNN